MQNFCNKAIVQISTHIEQKSTDLRNNTLIEQQNRSKKLTSDSDSTNKMRAKRMKEEIKKG